MVCYVYKHHNERHISTFLKQKNKDEMPERSLDWMRQRMREMPSFIVEESLNSVRVFWLKRDELTRELRKRAIELGSRDHRV